MLKKLFLFFFIIALLTVTAGASTVYYLVVVQPSPEVELENIKQILGKESNVYYSDGTTKLGVFFDQTHRQYVHYDDIPQSFVDALVSAEDNRFFSHYGVDPYGITRAIIANFQAGRVVQGGSTLTQQTAKNLFDRKDRSLKEKLKELLFALRLEHRYSKEQIFEFYANQFYVSGNGHGLGIAARYYFNKKPAELTMVESAFIAGSVKSPNYYNPFTKKTPESIQRAEDRANIRLGYVLGKMKELGVISDYEYTIARQDGVPFNKGQFGYELDYTMELVRNAVTQSFITNALEEHGIENISTSGVSIITSINKDVQDKALYGLRRQLSELDVRLRGYEREEVQAELASLEYRGDLRTTPDSFIFGEVTNISGVDKGLQIEVDFGLKLGTGIIDEDGIKRLTAARTQWTNNRWATPKAKDRASIIKQIEVGDKVWVSVRGLDENETLLLDLEKYPEIQGGALVTQKGAIQAVVGGSENRFFNRAIASRRTMGSSMKPFLYAAALQLGWNSADPLDNSRNIFIHNGQAYFPRPDHTSPFKWVSMSFAGTKSENLASIWLAYHLTDKLDSFQFKDLAENLGFTPKTVDGVREPYSSYQRRMRDRYGILVTNGTLQEAAYTEAIKNVETDFIFDGMSADYKVLQSLTYGRHFDRFRKEVSSQRQALHNQRKKAGKTLTGREVEEYQLRHRLLSKSFLQAGALKQDLLEYRKNLEWEYDFFALANDTATTTTQSDRTAYIYQSNSSGRYYFGYNLSNNDNFQILSKDVVQSRLEVMSNGQQNAFWNNVVLGSTISLGAYNMVKEQMALEYDKLKSKRSYDFETLSATRDFRVTVGLHYLIGLAREMGVESRLDPVLSFPLGSNVITLLESLHLYEGMVTGKTWSYADGIEDVDDGEIAIIERIETPDGKILYEATPYGTNVVDPQTSLALGNILENVVKHGTGRAAQKAVKLESTNEETQKELQALDLTVPLLGKTGTANNYTNAAFIGYLPGINKTTKQLTLENGYTVGVYVGFDDNKPMRYKTIRIAGSGGALAPWCTVVNQLMKTDEYADNLNVVDLSFGGLQLSHPNIDQLTLSMNLENGGLLTNPKQETTNSRPSIVTFGSKNSHGELVTTRYYRPYWHVMESSGIRETNL